MWQPASLGRVEHAALSREVRASARSFVRAAFRQLRGERVIPTPNYHPFVRVGRDYFGRNIMGTEYQELEALLERAYPIKFADPLSREYSDFASGYIFGLLEACVRRCAGQHGVGPGHFSADSREVTLSISEMLAVLDRDGHDVVVTGAISHATTASGAPMQLGMAHVIPDDPVKPSWDFFPRTMRAWIPGAGQAYNRELPDIGIAGRPNCLFALSGHTTGSPFERAAELSEALDRVLLALRLVSGTTARIHFEVHGPPTLVAGWNPHLVRHQTIAWPLVRRKLVLHASHAKAVDGLTDLLGAVNVRRDGMASNSLDIAVARYSASFQRDDLSALIDLSTAMEAVFIDEADGTEGLSGRLRARAAALLSTPTDSATNVFGDVKRLYDLRSRFVHGANLTERRLRETVLQISTITEPRAFGIAVAQAVDRMRDLTRRSILARVCLSMDDPAGWPFRTGRSMDVVFADSDASGQLKQSWRRTLGGIGAGNAWEALPAAVDLLREDFGPKPTADKRPD